MHSINFKLNIQLWLHIELGCRCVIMFWCHITDTLCVWSGECICCEGVFIFSTLKCVFRIPVQIPLSQHFILCRESWSTMQGKLFSWRMLLKALLLACVISPFTCCFEFYLNWDEKIRKRGVLADKFFFFPHSNLRHAKRLDVVFYTSVLVSASWDLTCFERERERDYSISPRICMRRAENINRPSDDLHIGSLLIWWSVVNLFAFEVNWCSTWIKCFSCVLVFKDAIRRKGPKLKLTS